MTRAHVGCLGGFALAAALWLWAARGLPWPAWPWQPDRMSLDQILLVYGLAPRGVIALVAGAALGLSGALLQVVLRNPVADPTTLGISAGAQLALVLATIAAPELMAGGGRWPVAMAGAGLAAALVMAIGARRAFAPVAMVIAGMLVGLTASAIATAVTLAQGEYLLSLVVWNGGALVQQDWSGVAALVPVLAAGGVAAALLARPLRVLSLGEAGAAGLGLNVAAVRLAAIGAAVVLAAAVSAELGLIGFVGLAAPALARLAGAGSIGARLVASAVLGALILSLADGLVLSLSRGTGASFPTGALTGLIGGPLLVWLLPRLRGSTPPPPPAPEATHRRARPARLLAGLAAAVLGAAVLMLWIGRVPGGWAVLDARSLASFLPLRLPRLVAAASAGAGLALAGAVLQRLTANPLASPEVLGVSGGAALGYAGVVFAAAAPGAVALTLGAMGGGAVALIVVLVLTAARDMPPERVLLAGIAVSALASAVLSAMMAVGDARAFRVLAWLSGSSIGVGPGAAAGLAALSLGLWVAALAGRRWLAIMPLGREVGLALGLPLNAARLALIAGAGLATGAATMLVGPLSFVGLMAPHLARRLGLVTPADHLTGSALIGAALMLAADFGARMAGFPYELPLGLCATLLGAPWLVWLMTRRP